MSMRDLTVKSKKPAKVFSSPRGSEGGFLPRRAEALTGSVFCHAATLDRDSIAERLI
jgi:hypothetical protein